MRTPLYDLTAEETLQIINDFINFPLEGLIVNNWDMDAAFRYLTGGRYPSDSWRYLTVVDLLTLISSADRISQCGAIKPLLEGICYHMDDTAEVYLFASLHNFCQPYETPGDVAEQTIKEIKDLDNNWLLTPATSTGRENRTKIKHILYINYLRIFSRLIENREIESWKDDIMSKIQMICEEW